MEGGDGGPFTVEQVFGDFQGRRAAIIKALTTEVDGFFERCDPDKENFCLYAYPNGKWKVDLPAEEVPPEIPEPALGINFARDGMSRKDWVTLVAAHSEGWLFSVAFYFAARFGFDKADRKMLFNMINDLPTVFEIVTGASKKQLNGKSSIPNHSGSKSKSNSKSRSAEFQKKSVNVNRNEEEGWYEGVDEEEEEHGNTTLCGACGKHNGADEFWICCDKCERWFHGWCVKITPAKAEHLKQYKCPSCMNKRARP